MIYSRLSLRYRIALVIFLLEVCMLAVVLSVTFSQSRQSLNDFDVASQKASLDLLANLSVAALLTGEYGDYQLYLQDVEKQPSIDGIVLADIQNRVVAASQVANVGKMLTDIPGFAGWRTRTVDTAAGQLGVLGVKFSDELLTASYRRTRNLALGLAAAGMTIIALVGLATGIALTRRLERVADTARRFADGQVDARSRLSGRDEVALLARNVDQMADAVAAQQRQLREQAEYIGLLLNSTAEAIYGVDTAGICTFANPACLRMLGYEQEGDLVGHNIHALIHHTYPDGRPYPKEQCRVRRSTLHGEPAHADDEVHWRADGSSFPVEYWSHPMYRDGQLIGAVVTFVDITARKQAEAALRESEARLRSIIEAAPVPFALNDDDQNIIYVNPAFVETYGYTLDDIPTLAEWWPRAYPDPAYRQWVAVEWSARLERSRQQGSVFEPMELDIHGKDGSVRSVLASATSLGQGFAGTHLVILYDITARKQAEAEVRRYRDELERRVETRTTELRAANRELEAFSYSISHDLRAPLRAIDGFSRIVLEDHAAQLDGEARDYLGRVRRAVQRMGMLIDDLLELSRVGRMEMQVMDVDLSAIAHEVLEHLRASEPGRTVTVTIASGLRGRGDERLVRLLLQNLLDNAWKYTRRTVDAHIEFGAETGTPVSYYVRDNGAGFDMQYVHKLFQPFQRLHRAEDFEGAGVGLATVARIIHRHGGRVWAEAEVGKGTTFHFTLVASERLPVSAQST